MKATHFWKNGRLLRQSLSPLEHPKENNPATVYQASPTLGCTQGSFPSNTRSFGKHGRLQHHHPGILKEESQRASLCPPSV